MPIFVDNQQNCDNCLSILDELENIDDDTDRHGISFVKTQDLNIATNFGVSEFPALIYFENQVPSIYEGELASEDVLQWLIEQKTEDRIETVTRSMLESLLLNVQYLAVYFCKLQNSLDPSRSSCLILPKSLVQTSPTARPAIRCSSSWRTLTTSAIYLASKW